jgi:hypothetical protein
LNIEKNEVGFVLFDKFYGFRAVAAFAKNFNTLLIGQKTSDALTRQRFVVNN